MGENWNPFLRPQGYFRCIRCTCKLVSTSFILSSIPFLVSHWPIFMCISKNPDSMGLFLWTCESSSYCLGVSMKLFIYFLKIKPHHATLSLFLICIYIFFDDWLLSTCIQWSPEPTLFENALETRNIKKTPTSHSPGFALNTPNLAYFTPKLFRWLRLRRESLLLQKFLVTNTVLSLPFSQQIQFTIRVTVVNLH